MFGDRSSLFQHPEPSPWRAYATTHVINRLPPRADNLRNLGAIGVATWRDLRDILEDCAASDALAPPERAIANHALEWLG